MSAHGPRLCGIYALVEPARHRDPLGYVDALLGAGVTVLQVRDKRGIERELLRAIVAHARSLDAIAIVNDDVAAAELADGVHVGQEDLADLDLRAVRARLGARCIGISCGTPAEARAVDPALVDYLGVGPIFATHSKADAGGPIGVSGVRAVVAATSLPCAAIGGITLASIPRVRETGAAMAAIISALAASDDPAATARAFVAAWNA